MLYLGENDQYFAEIDEFRKSEIALRLERELQAHSHLREVKRNG